MTPALLALLVFLALQLGIGVYLSKRISSEADYLIGGRTLGYTLATFSLFATWFGAETVIGSSSTIYTEGFSLASPEPFGYGLCLILMGALLARPLWNRGLTTPADLFRQRFGTQVERLAVLLLVPSSVLWAAAQIRAFGQVLSTASLLTPETGIAIAAIFVIAYTMFGGLLADAVTDVLQGTILIGGLLITLGAVVLRVGGVGASWDLLATTDRLHVLPASGSPWLTIEAWAIPVIGSVAANEIVSRVIAARSATVARRSALLAGGMYIGIGSIPILIALLARSLAPDLSHPEQLLPTIARDSLPPILFAVFAGGLVAAILSTVDSTLLVASGLLSHNLIVPLLGIQDERDKVRLARGGVLAFGLIAWLLALNSDGVFTLVQEASAMGSAGIVVCVLFGLFTAWGSARTAALTLMTGVLSYAVARWGIVHPTPFLLSLGCALSAWTLGCLIDRVRR